MPREPLARARLRPVEPPRPRAPWTWGRVLGELAPYLLLITAAGPLAIGYAAAFRRSPNPISWDRPWAFVLLALVPLLALFHFHLRRRRAATMLYSHSARLAEARRSLGHYLVHLPRVLRLVAVGLLVLALARPQRPTLDSPEVEGIDIVIALDVSNSMTERDLKPDRIGSAKEVLKSFIHHRRSDRVGLVIFGREAFTQCPLTLDYHALGTLLDDVRIGLIDGHGTAIGNALATALNRLRKSEARSKVIILITDGDNNAGNISPEQAARYAQSLGVRVFTILMGRDATAQNQGAVPGMPGFGPFVRPPPRFPVNPKLLERIAQQTGGTPYLATDTPALEQRFQSILDELERSRFREQRSRPDDLYAWFLVPGLGLLFLELILGWTRFRRFP